jgi:hypothetical protein
LSVVVDGVTIPFVDLPILIKSKSTYRDQDRVDVEILREIARRHPRRSDST